MYLPLYTPFQISISLSSNLNALKDAIEHRTLFDSDQWREIQNIINDMREREVRARLAEALGNPNDSIRGEIGRLRMSTVTVKRLEAAIHFAQDVGCETGASRRLLLAAQVLKRLRSEVLSSDWELVRRTIDTAKDMVSTNKKQRQHNCVIKSKKSTQDTL